jgi:hypothetical protein
MSGMPLDPIVHSDRAGPARHLATNSPYLLRGLENGKCMKKFWYQYIFLMRPGPWEESQSGGAVRLQTLTLVNLAPSSCHGTWGAATSRRSALLLADENLSR